MKTVFLMTVITLMTLGGRAQCYEPAFRFNGFAGVPYNLSGSVTYFPVDGHIGLELGAVGSIKTKISGKEVIELPQIKPQACFLYRLNQFGQFKYEVGVYTFGALVRAFIELDKTTWIGVQVNTDKQADLTINFEL